MRLNDGTRKALRLTLALLALATLGAALWAASKVGEAQGASGSFPLTVTGPEGTIFDGTVEAEDATALSVLQEASRLHGFPVEVEDHPAYGDCGSYVRAIDGHEEEGTAGWVYEVHQDGEWWRPPLGSSCQPLEEGQAVRWLWVEHE